MDKQLNVTITYWLAEEADADAGAEGMGSLLFCLMLRLVAAAALRRVCLELVELL